MQQFGSYKGSLLVGIVGVVFIHQVHTFRSSNFDVFLVIACVVDCWEGCTNSHSTLFRSIMEQTIFGPPFLSPSLVEVSSVDHT